MSISKSLVALFLLACISLVLMVPSLNNWWVLGAIFILGILLVFMDGWTDDYLYFTITFLVLALVFLGAIASPYPWLFSLTNNFALSVIGTFLLITFIVSLMVILIMAAAEWISGLFHKSVGRE